ncbi:hypothetical protein NDU88_003009 [Pleurodeles waltl]|uniref:Uncharacterized protein n=1 Tax=Pleurodeles waltl TaxID=8319 RepID=A0AAV7RH88_PLEWA|nr:hypothetical protein NDU88_003009 [Pleurodeles waltl]
MALRRGLSFILQNQSLAPGHPATAQRGSLRGHWRTMGPALGPVEWFPKESGTPRAVGLTSPVKPGTRMQVHGLRRAARRLWRRWRGRG